MAKRFFENEVVFFAGELSYRSRANSAQLRQSRPESGLGLSHFRVKDVLKKSCSLLAGRVQEGRCKATWKREFKLPWRAAGPPNHPDDKVDSDQ